MIAGEEVCPSTGLPHWQGYVELKKNQRMKAVKEALGDEKTHLEVRRGTRDEARAYCMKDGKWEEHGQWIKGQGHRSDLDDVASRLISGETNLTTLMAEEPKLYCQYRNGLKDLAAEGIKRTTKVFRELEVEVISGPTGVGKTRGAIESVQGEYYKIEGDNMQWWDGYNQEETLIIDEYDNDLKVTKLLNILDGYQLRLSLKGSFTYANWKRVIITTNLTRGQLHGHAKEAHREALMRRITRWTDLW